MIQNRTSARLVRQKEPLMWEKSNWAIIFSTLLCVLVLFPPSAHAYIDPGTGSYILQIAIAGIAAGAIAIKMFWKRIKALFSSNRAQDNTDQDLNE
jgi:hypothetical protein